MAELEETAAENNMKFERTAKFFLLYLYCSSFKNFSNTFVFKNDQFDAMIEEDAENNLTFKLLNKEAEVLKQSDDKNVCSIN